MRACPSSRISALLNFKLGFGHYLQVIQGWSDDVDADLRQVGEYARRGMAKGQLTPLEGKLGHWLMVYVQLMNRDFPAALGEAEAAIEKAPSDPYLLPTLGDAANANKQYRQGSLLDRLWTEERSGEQGSLFGVEGLDPYMRGTLQGIGGGHEGRRRLLRRHPAH